MTRFRQGFTLIELLIVIAVIGILAAVLVVVLNPNTQIKKARDAGRKSALKQLQSTLEQYNSDTGSYPDTSCWSGNSLCWTLGSGSFLGANAANYTQSLPTDPKQSGDDCTGATSYGYYYYTSDSGKTYQVITRLEITNDPFVQIGPLGGCDNVFNYSLANQQ